MPRETYIKYGFDHMEARDNNGKLAYIYSTKGYFDQDKNVMVFDLLYSPYSSTMTSEEFISASKLTWQLYGVERYPLEDGDNNNKEVPIGDPFILKIPK